MSYRIRIWSPFHLETQSIPILNLNSPKNEKRILRSCNFSPDHISYIITVIISLFKVKYNQISAEPSNYNSQQKGLHHIFVSSAGQHRLGLDRWSASTVQASTLEAWDENHGRACVLCVFMGLKIRNRLCLNV